MFDLRFVHEVVGGALLAGPMHASTTFTSVSTDSRRISPGALFVALVGERHDGHAFAAAAVEGGALGVVVARRLALPERVVQIVVGDPLLALQRLAQAHRRRFGLPVLAITGSNGKTTTKAMAASVFAAAFGPDAICATRGNLNNHIGVPLTLLELTAQHRAAVVEMGMNHFGEIAQLTRLAEPSAALITNAGPAHLEGVGSLAGVAKAKGEIFEALRPGGVALLNRDDAFYAYWHVLTREFRQVSFGFDARADVCGSLSSDGRLSVILPEGRLAVRMPLPGTHNARNALGVVAAAWSLGIDPAAIQRGIESARFEAQRLERKRLGNGTVVIDDSYNANPASMLAAIEVLAQEPGRRLLVLGDMAELGAASTEGHRQVARAALSAPIHGIFVLGEAMREAFSTERVPQGVTFECVTTIEALIEALLPCLDETAVVLVKASRAMGLERVVMALERRFGRQG
ncbi:MAG: UDP-N-acetylmuramoyl-tripeptide--D-alanyl-D-alanine ligase [Burkholderiales bacterium]|nr:UDP-N-acetylmuramoyl-tripeptide--D-alanyl-D-alanine ligase [Burkholderiales bacterium]